MLQAIAKSIWPYALVDNQVIVISIIIDNKVAQLKSMQHSFESRMANAEMNCISRSKTEAIYFEVLDLLHISHASFLTPSDKFFSETTLIF